MFEVTTPASSRALLSVNELRVAAGLSPSDSSQDTRLAELGLRAADAIARHCGVAVDGVNPPTLLSEICVDTIRPERAMPSLILRRRFVTAIAAVSEDGVALGAGSYELDKAAGLVRRIYLERRVSWQSRLVVVQYTAGFTTIHPDLKQAAEMYVRQIISQFSRDSLLRSESVDGVGDFDYWVGSIDAANGSPLPSDVAALVAPFMAADL